MQEVNVFSMQNSLFLSFFFFTLATLAFVSIFHHFTVHSLTSIILIIIMNIILFASSVLSRFKMNDWK